MHPQVNFVPVKLFLLLTSQVNIKCEVRSMWKWILRKKNKWKEWSECFALVFACSLTFCIKLRSTITLCLLMYRVYRDRDKRSTWCMRVHKYTQIRTQTEREMRMTRLTSARELSSHWIHFAHFPVPLCMRSNKVTKAIKVAHHFFPGYNLQVNWSLETSQARAKKQVQAIFEWKRSLKLTRRRSSYRLCVSCIVVCASCFIAEQWQSEWFINWCGRRHLLFAVSLSPSSSQSITRVSSLLLVLLKWFYSLSRDAQNDRRLTSSCASLSLNKCSTVWLCVLQSCKKEQGERERGRKHEEEEEECKLSETSATL